MANCIAVYAACVLIPISSATCCRGSRARICSGRAGTDESHEEWIRALPRNHPEHGVAKWQRTRHVMDAAVPDCLITGYEPMIPSWPSSCPILRMGTYLQPRSGQTLA